jgi:hypothetical protein
VAVQGSRFQKTVPSLSWLGGRRWNLMRTTRWICGAALAVLVACIWPTNLCGCSPVEYPGHVVGFVRDTTGSPAIATVIASVRDRQCRAARPGVMIFQGLAGVETDSTGRYYIELLASAPETVCVRLVARRTGSADSTVRDSLRISLVRGDTLRADFTLP